MLRRRLSIAALFAVGLLAVAGRAAFGQETSPVTVADSPVALQLFQQAIDQARENPSESARLCQRLLDGFAERVIPADDPPGDRFENVLERVERFLREHPSTLERYRQMESAEAERLTATATPEFVARTRGLTAAGLRAHVTLAERDLHAARFDRVIARLSRIEGHPDLGDSATTTSYWFLRGAAAALSGITLEREEALARLRALPAADAVPASEAIARLAAVEPAFVGIISSPLGVGEAPESVPVGADRDWQPIWSIALPGTAFARAFLGTNVPTRPDFQLGPGNGNMFFNDLNAPVLPRQFDRARFDGSMLSVAPTVGGDTVIVSDGSVVLALDRLSHRTVWTCPIALDAAGRESPPSDELACIATNDDSVIAYSGTDGSMDRVGAGQVTCIARATGVVRWEAVLSLLGGGTGAPRADGAPGVDPFEGLYPTGEPVIDGGAVFVLARKLTPQLETVEYLLSFDLRTGELRWATFLCSSGGMPRLSARPGSRPVVADGSVYVATTVGAVCRIDAADGRVRWAHRFLVPLRDLRYPCEPWELGGPAVVGESVFAISPDQSEIVQFEKASGRRIQSFPTGPSSVWGTPRYLLFDGGADVRSPRIFAVGADVLSIDPDAPTRKLWSLSKANEKLFAEREGVTNRSGIRGRVQLAGDVLVVPGLRDVLLASRETGRVTERIETEGPANPVLVGPLLFLGQNASVTALMPTASAERVMRERIASAPTDPEGGLALLDLGLKTRRLDLCTEGAGAARDALAKGGPNDSRQARSELVERLLRTMRLDDAAGESGEAVLAVLGDVATLPAQRVRHLIARSEWLQGRGRPDDAVQALDGVLADERLASISVEDGSWLTRPAAMLAAERLAALGRSTPAAFIAREAAAQAQLDAAGDDVERLLAFVNSAMGTTAAHTAAVRLAKALERGGRPQAALAVLTRGLRGLADDTEPAHAIIAAAVALCEAQGWSRYAKDLAEAASGRFPEARGSGGTLLSELVDEFEHPIRLGPIPREAVELPGRLVRMALSVEARRRLDGVLLASEHDLILLDPRTLTPRWTSRIEDRDPIVLMVGGPLGDAALLWQERPDGGQFASLVSLADGAVLAMTPPLRDALPPEATLAAGRPVLQVMPDGDHFDPSEVVPFIADRMLVAVRRNGDAVGFNIADLSKPVWKASGVLSQVYSVAVSDLVVALGGREAGEGDELPPALATLDPVTGMVLARHAVGQADEIHWLRLAPSGELLIGTGEGVEAMDALAAFSNVAGSDGRSPLLWKNESPAARDTVAGWRFGQWLVASDRAEVLTALALRDGRLDETRFRPPPRLDRRSGALRWAGRVADGVLVQFEDRVVAFTLDGTLLGDDALIDDGNYVFLLPIEGGLLSVRSSGSRQVPYPLTGGMRTEFPYLIHRLSVAQGCRLLGPALQIRLSGQRCERLGAADGVLFFSTPVQTIAVPMPPSQS